MFNFDRYLRRLQHSVTNIIVRHHPQPITLKKSKQSIRLSPFPNAARIISMDSSERPNHSVQYSNYFTVRFFPFDDSSVAGMLPELFPFNQVLRQKLSWKLPETFRQREPIMQQCGAFSHSNVECVVQCRYYRMWLSRWKRGQTCGAIKLLYFTGYINSLLSVSCPFPMFCFWFFPKIFPENR